MLLVTAFPMFILSLVALSFAQIQLLARAFVPPRNIMLEVFRSLDKFFESLNSWTTRGVVLARDFDTGPMFEPIAWRETRKRSLGTVRYLFRLLVVLEVPLAIAIIWTLADNTVSSFNGPTIFFLGLLWPIAALAVTVHATNVMISERSRQTLDVLLVTPISARELISQKLAGVRRLIGVLSVPFLTLLIFQTIWSFYVVSGLDHFRNANLEFIVFLHEVLAMAFALVVYPRVLQWMAFLMALVMKNQTQAVLTSLAIIIALCVGPFLLLQLTSFLMPYLGPPDESPFHWITWLSPVRSLFHREFSHNYTRFSGYYPPTVGTNVLSEDWWFIGLIGHMVIYLTLWLVLRLVALRSFSTCVGRAEPVGGTA
jgi:ABC-type transport system involved in multi-copper enzyme maturation permease subunit